jgi:hypothetical protein
MLRSLAFLTGYSIRATDGVIGQVDEAYFDDAQWAIRYLVVETGIWLDRRVLITPISIIRADWEGRAIDVALTKAQVKDSPSVDANRPVSRRFESAYFAHFGFVPYWGGPAMWAAASYPGSFANGTLAATRAGAEAEGAAATESDAGQEQDSHLHSSKEVKGYHIAALDGAIGHVDDFVVDDGNWAIRFIEVDTSNWIGGRSVMVPRNALREVSWVDRTLHVALTRQQVERSPRPEETGLSEAYERQLTAHYGAEHAWGEDPRT